MINDRMELHKLYKYSMVDGVVVSEEIEVIQSHLKCLNNRVSERNGCAYLDEPDYMLACKMLKCYELTGYTTLYEMETFFNEEVKRREMFDKCLKFYEWKNNNTINNIEEK